MSELSDIAASVARALKLILSPNATCWEEWLKKEGMYSYLEKDGSNVFNQNWQIRCRDWLLQRGKLHFGDETIDPYYVRDRGHRFEERHTSNGGYIQHHLMICPAAEFCARAIHELMKAKP